MVDDNAEGYGRNTIADYLRSLCIAYGSNCELETQMMLSRDSDYLSRERVGTVMDKMSEVERMLNGLIKSLEEKPLSKIYPP